MTIIQALAVSFALAFLTESFTEYLFGQAFEHLPVIGPYRWLLMYLSAVVGVGLAFSYSLDLIAIIQLLAGATEVPITAVGMILTGLGLGRGANWLHEFVSKYLKQKAVV